MVYGFTLYGYRLSVALISHASNLSHPSHPSHLSQLAAVKGDKLSLVGSPINYNENPMDSNYGGWKALPTPDAVANAMTGRMGDCGTSAAIVVVSPEGRKSFDGNGNGDGNVGGVGGLDDTTIDVELIENGGWIKVLDPETGRPFFFNEATGASLWHAPEGAGFEDATMRTFTKQRRKAMSPKRAYRVTEQEI